MNRLSFHARPGRWLLLFGACAVVTLFLVLHGSRAVKVAVYNDSGDPWHTASIAVGRDVRHLRHLPLNGTGSMEEFAPQEIAASVELTAEGTRIVHWSAPYLIQPDTGHVIIRVDRWGGVTATSERRLLSKLFQSIK